MSASLLETAETEVLDTERQLIAFHLADEMYGLDITTVHTVITPQPITRVPKAAPYVKGVINLRGRVLPVIDLRTRFGMPVMPEEISRHSRIVIVETDGLSAGLIVDSVTEVLRLPADTVDPPSQLVTSVETECITGIGRIPVGRRDGELHDSQTSEGVQGIQERLIILLDVLKTLAVAPQDAHSLRQLGRAA